MKLRPVRTNALLLFSVLFILSFFSCRKAEIKNDESLTDQTEVSFFVGLTASSTQVARVAEELKKQGAHSNLLTSIVKKYGYLKWEKSIVRNPIPRGVTNNKTTGTDTIVIIPIIEKGSAIVKSYIEAHLSDSVTLNLIASNKYSQLPFSNTQTEINQAEKHAIRFMLLNRELFQYNSFRLIDNRLFGATVNKKDSGSTVRTVTFANDNQASNAAGRMVYEEICVYVTTTTTDYHCTHTGSCASGVCDGCSLCVTSSSSTSTYCEGWWSDDGSGGGGGSSGGDDTGGGGGSTGGGGTGGGGTTDPCGAVRIVNARLPCEGDGSDGWVPVEEIFPDLDAYGNYIDDESQYTTGDFDNTPIPFFDLQTQPWPTISNVIPITQFVEYDRSNCLDLAKAQIGVKGYRISGYGAAGQTFITYTQSTGVDNNATKDGISYLISALQRGIPVIVGVDYKSGPSPGNPDNTTDHFVVIVGMGTDSNGKYFTFFDNATNFASKGASPSNKLYYNETTGLIQGQTSVTYSDGTKLPLYTVTQIRKSK